MNSPKRYYECEYDLTLDFDFVEEFNPSSNYRSGKFKADYGNGDRQYVLRKIKLQKEVTSIVDEVNVRKFKEEERLIVHKFDEIVKTKTRTIDVEYVYAFEIYDEVEMRELEKFCKCSSCKEKDFISNCISFCFGDDDVNVCLMEGYRHPRFVAIAREWKKRSEKSQCNVQ